MLFYERGLLMTVIKNTTVLYVIILCSAFFYASISHATIDTKSPSSSLEQLIISAEQLRFTDVDKANSTLMEAYNLSKVEGSHETTIEIILLQAKIAITQKDYYLAQQYLRRGELLLAEYEHITHKVYVLSGMADVKHHLKKFTESKKYIDEAILLARESQKDELIFITLEIKGNIERSRHRHAEALAIYIDAERYAKNMPDQDVMRLSKNLAYVYAKTNALESSARYYSKVAQLLEKMGHTRDIPDNLLDLALTQRKMSLYDKALESSSKALNLARQNKDEINELRALVIISVIYRRLSSYEKALTYALQAYTLYEKNQNLNGLASAAKSIGLIYKNLDQDKNATNYFNQILALPEDLIQSHYRAAALRELGLILFFEGDYEKGLDYSDQAATLFNNKNNKNGVATVHKNVGKMYKSLGKTDDALVSYKLAKDIFKSTGDVWSEALVNSLIAKLIAKKDPLKAIAYAELSIETAQKSKAKSIIKNGYSAMIDANSKLKNYKLALHYSRLKEKLLEEMKYESMNKRVGEIYIVLDIEKKEKELQNYKRQQAITSLELNRTKAALDILNKEKEISALEHKNTLFVTVIAFTLFILIYIMYRRKNTD